MHALIVIKIVGATSVILGLALLVPAAVSAGYGDGDWVALILNGVAAVLLGSLLWVGSRGARTVSVRDGFAVVAAAWATAAVVGATPYYFTHTIPRIPDALFESISGFTTTGATVIEQYEGISHGLLLWRSLTEWLGGMGIVVLAVAVLPALGVGGMRLFEREVTGPIKEKFTARLRDTAIVLWSIYVGLTLLEVVLLVVLGMGPFEAINHAMTTIATGGFSTRAESIGGFNSRAIEWVIIGFMLISGMNFSLHYGLLRTAMTRHYIRDLEWRWYVAGVIAFAVAISGYLYLRQGYGLGDSLTKGTFQAVSIGTSTGFASDDYVRWGAFPQLILLIAMLIGGCAGSTSGGIKWVRIVLSFKSISVHLLRLLHPNVVPGARYGDRSVDDQLFGAIGAFLFLFGISTGVVALLVSLDGYSLLTSIGAAASSLGNIGPALEAFGPTETFADVSAYTKFVLMGGMLLGRLELMTIVILFLPRAWHI